MAILSKKERGLLTLNKVAKLSVVSLLTSMAYALVSTIWALYLDSFIHSEVWVGFFSAGLTLIAFVSYFLFIPVIERNNKIKIYAFSLFLLGVTYLLFAINTNLHLLILLSITEVLVYTFRVTSFGIIVRDNSKKKKLSENEGVLYTLSNLSYVVGPLIAGYLANVYSLKLVFFVSSVFLFLSFFVFESFRFKDGNIKKESDGDLIKNFVEFFNNKERFIAYLLGGGVNFWWALIYIFIPLHIIREGLSDLMVGYFFFAIAVPLILTEYKFAKVASKIGFRKIFKTGFFIVAVLSLACFFVSNIYVVLILLVLASFGMAMLEPTTEAYFLDILKTDENVNRFYGPYNTTIDLNHFFAKSLAATILIFLPFKFLFVFFAVIMFGYFILSFKTKNIIEAS